MESFIVKLAVAVIPLCTLIASVIVATSLPQAHQPLSWHRRRHHMLRGWSHGTLLR